GGAVAPHVQKEPSFGRSEGGDRLVLRLRFSAVPHGLSSPIASSTDQYRGRSAGRRACTSPSPIRHRGGRTERPPKTAAECWLRPRFVPRGRSNSRSKVSWRVTEPKFPSSSTSPGKTRPRDDQGS